jgi:hypothetical protein
MSINDKPSTVAGMTIHNDDIMAISSGLDIYSPIASI